DLGGVIGHGAEAMRDHVVEVTNGGSSQPVGVVRRWTSEAALYADTVAVTQRPVADGTVDSEPLRSPLQHVAGDSQGERIHMGWSRQGDGKGVQQAAGPGGKDRCGTAGFLGGAAPAGEVGTVDLQVAAGNGALRQGPGGAAVAEELALFQRQVLRLPG